MLRRPQEEYVILDGEARFSSSEFTKNLFVRNTKRKPTHTRGYHEYSDEEKAKMAAFEVIFTSDDVCG